MLQKFLKVPNSLGRTRLVRAGKNNPGIFYTTIIKARKLVEDKLNIVILKRSSFWVIFCNSGRFM
jgi:hypothetical protein